MDPPPTKPERPGITLTVTGLMVWVGGLAAIAGLVEESIRMARIEPAGGLIGGILVAYVIYLSLSVPVFWKAPSLIIPTTMLIGGVLWTISLQSIGRPNLAMAAVILPILPFLTVFLARMIFRKTGDPAEGESIPDGPSTVRSLLMRNRGLGLRSAPIKFKGGPEV